jgi:acyl carrier protein
MDSYIKESLIAKLAGHVNHVLEGSGRPPVAEMTEQSRLRQDLQLDSLELAELTVRLEAQFGVDVFREGIVETVGEVVKRLEAEKC